MSWAPGQALDKAVDKEVWSETTWSLHARLGKRQTKLSKKAQRRVRVVKEKPRKNFLR